jgi:hypothetical protein
MFITKLALPRRTFLHGMGAALALPLLDAMVPARTAWRRPPRTRSADWDCPSMGMNAAAWTPIVSGR